ncbi:MAG TPA: hypothetical protein DCY40_09075 [Actinobacteria bacterium]|nr:hypothetical protein [Actinomycetota bacterium]
MTDHAPSPQRLATVAAALERIDLDLAGAEAVVLAGTARRLVAEYLLPRVTDPEADLVVAVVGVSGAGKSTLVNSLARRRLTATGVRRPTTTEPVAWGPDTLPPTLDAMRRRLPGRMVDTLLPPPPGVVILDTPPPDVRDVTGRAVCHDLLDVADACILVTAANRYADAAGFELARRAADRGVTTLFVLNRLPPTPELQRVLVADFADKLTRAGLMATAEPEGIIAIAEGVISVEREGLASEAVIGLRKAIDLIADPTARVAVMSRTVAGTTAQVQEALVVVRTALITAAARRVELGDPVRLAYSSAGGQVAEAVRSGAFAEIKDDPEALVAALAAATARRAGRAALHSADRWDRLGAATGAGLFTHGGETPQTARERFEWWQSELPRLATELSGRKVRPRRAVRLTAAARDAVFDPGHEPDRRERRLLRRYPGLVAAAAERLSEELAGIVATDSTRFTSALGPVLPSGIIADLDLETAP